MAKLSFHVNEVRQHKWELALALFIALAGALIFGWLRMPLPWMLGPLFGVTIAALSGVNIWMPEWPRSLMIGVLGVFFGTTISPDFAEQILTWLPSIVTLLISVTITTAIVMAYFRAFAGHDPVTAYFSANPGGMIPMALMGRHYGGDERLISMIQSIRMVLTVITFPIAFRFLAGYEPTGIVGTGATLTDMAPIDFPVILALAIVGALVAKRLRVPVPLLLGPMILIGFLSVAGVGSWQIPDGLVAFAQLVIGARIGATFKNIRLKTVGVQLVHAVIAAYMMMGLAVLFAWLATFASEIPAPALILAFAPGGFAEMTIVGFGLGADIAFIVSHQLIRFFFIIGLVPVAVRIMKFEPKEP
ncbi:MAG: AbrB family transcriptional regulator [Rhodospirillaceae bacterium]|nr:AbrB family transcriptional regulator [Rhodospirillaceae bacterium]